MSKEFSLPSQFGNSGKILGTDGTNPLWTNSGGNVSTDGTTILGTGKPTDPLRSGLSTLSNLTFTATANPLVYTLSFAPAPGSTFIYDGNQPWIEGVDYTVSGTTFTAINGAPVGTLTGKGGQAPIAIASPSVPKYYAANDAAAIAMGVGTRMFDILIMASESNDGLPTNVTYDGAGNFVWNVSSYYYFS